ncbi:MAG: prepilin-type N-terminal cleavage/methylation domain-containing protein [Syntrophaceae bacterium]|nr:prepilin-type N-terminal cleavage/methylation domain-containing protein [Syntrophaceae bacterium]
MNGSICEKKGFTLLEVLVVLILAAVLAAAAVFGYVQVVKGTLFTKKNAATIQKGQVTITKLVKEFNNINISSITAAGPTSITFTSIKNAVPGAHTVSFSGNTITYDDDILTDQVSGFELKYYDNYDSTGETTWQPSRRIIEITLKLKGADDVISEFKARVKPRNA